MGFKELIQFVLNGEPVAAGTPNRPLRTLDDNVRYLKAILEAAEIGSTVFARDQTVESGANVGMPVYYNANNQRFERALAAVETDSTTGQLVAAASSQVWGVVYEKTNATLADILLFGHATLDVAAALADDDTAIAGLYFLSGATAGRLVRQRPPVSVPVLRSDGDGNVFVNPNWQDFLADHVHYRFNLTARPAGSHAPPTSGGLHVITAADADQPGWLPAGHASFDGNAPAGAAFGYNLAAHPGLLSLWPPIPPSGAVLEINGGGVFDDADIIAGRVPDELVTIDRNGIWWMSDCYRQVPWDPDLDTSASESASASASESACPVAPPVTLTLWFTRHQFFTEASAVTSLVSDDDRVVIECATQAGKAASTGPLVIRLALQFLINSVTTRGYLALKGLTDDNEKFNFGPVVEGVYAGSSNVAITGDATSKVDPDDAGSADMYHGKIKVTVNTELDRELFPQTVRLDGTTEEFYQDNMYIGFPDDEETAVRLRFSIPAALSLTSPKAKLRLRLLGRAAGTLPQLVVTSRRLAAPADLTDDAVALPAVDSAVTIVTTRVIDTANDYVEVESSLLTIVAGDDLDFTIQRDAVDGYTGEVGILRQSIILSAGG